MSEETVTMKTSIHKQKIMEVLLSAENSLTQNDIQWAIKNIPNDDGEKDNLDSRKFSNHKFDHAQQIIEVACGVGSESLRSKLIDEVLKLYRDCGPKKSMFVEEVFRNGSDDLIIYLIMNSLNAVFKDAKSTEEFMANVGSIFGATVQRVSLKSLFESKDDETSKKSSISDKIDELMKEINRLKSKKRKDKDSPEENQS